MLSGEGPKTVIIKRGEKMERYGKKQWLAEARSSQKAAPARGLAH